MFLTTFKKVSIAAVLYEVPPNFISVLEWNRRYAKEYPPPITLAIRTKSYKFWAFGLKVESMNISDILKIVEHWPSVGTPDTGCNTGRDILRVFTSIADEEKTKLGTRN